MNRLVEELEAEAQQRALERGLKQGLEQGREQGLEQARTMLTEILTWKHGRLPDDILDRWRRYDARRLLRRGRLSRRFG